MMLACLKSKTSSQPVRRLICEKLALLLTTRANYQVRSLIHKQMMTQMSVAKTSQQRQVFLFFIEALLPLISCAHFNQVYLEVFFGFKEEVVSQIVIQYVQLFPLARTRIIDPRVIDRLDLILRALTQKYQKMARVSHLQSVLVEVAQKLKDVEFQK